MYFFTETGVERPGTDLDVHQYTYLFPPLVMSLTPMMGDGHPDIQWFECRDPPMHSESCFTQSESAEVSSVDTMRATPFEMFPSPMPDAPCHHAG